MVGICLNIQYKMDTCAKKIYHQDSIVDPNGQLLIKIPTVSVKIMPLDTTIQTVCPLVQ